MGTTPGRETLFTPGGRGHEVPEPTYYGHSSTTEADRHEQAYLSAVWKRRTLLPPLDRPPEPPPAPDPRVERIQHLEADIERARRGR